MPELMQGEFRVSASNKGCFCNMRYAVRMLPFVKNPARFFYAECDKDCLKSRVQRIPVGKIRFGSAGAYVVHLLLKIDIFPAEAPKFDLRLPENM